MATVSAETFFGGKVPPPPAATTPAATAPHPLDGLGVSDRIKADFLKRAQNDKSINQSNQSLPSKILQNLGQGAGFVADVPADIIKSIVPQPIKDAVKTAAQTVVNTPPVQDVVAKYAEFKTAHPEAAANLEATGLIASILPIGKTAGAGEELATAGAGKVLEGAGKAATVAGRATAGAGEALFKTAVTPTVEEAKRIQSFNAKVPFLDRVSNTLTGAAPSVAAPVTRADTALKTGLVGRNVDLGVQATRQADKLYTETIAPAVKASPVRITTEDLFAPIRERIATEVDPTRRAGLENAFQAIQADYKSTKDFSLEQAQALKRSLAKFTPSKIFKGQEVASELRTLQADMATAIRQKTYGALKDDNIKQAYLDYGNLSELKKLGVKALTDATSKGGFGSFWSGMWDKATVPVKTVGGQVLYRVGNKLEFVGERGLKTFGQFLQKKGYQKP